MANKKADFKLNDMEAIKRQTNVKNCWFDDTEGLFHCIMQDNTEWTSPTGSAQDMWIRVPKIPKASRPLNTGNNMWEELNKQLETTSSDFVKADSGKLQWSLLPFAEVEEVVKVLMKGASKYSPDNWKKCDNTKRYEDALMRHVIAYIKGNKIDEVSQGGDGLSHLAHAVCNCLFLMWFDNQKEE